MTVVDHLQAALVGEEHIPRRIPWDCTRAATAGGGDRPLNWQSSVHNDTLRAEISRKSSTRANGVRYLRVEQHMGLKQDFIGTTTLPDHGLFALRKVQRPVHQI